MARKQSKPILPLDLVIDEYERDLRRHDFQPATIDGYHKVLNQVHGVFVHLLNRAPTLDDFTVANVERYMDDLLDRVKPNGEHLSPETLRTYIRALKAFSSWLAADKQKYTDQNRLKLLRMPRKVGLYKQPLDLAEMQALIHGCDVTTALGTRDLSLLLTFLDGGLRAQEVINLHVSDVNLESGQLFIASGKGRKTRMVTVGDDTKRILRRYAFFRDAVTGSATSSAEAFFQTERGTQLTYNGLKEMLRRLKTRAGVPRVFIHLLRHTSAIRTLEVPGSDIFTLQAKLGHADITTTRHYLNMTSEKLSERQRTFSPIDHLGLDGMMRLTPPEKTDCRMWHQRKQRKDR